MEINEHILRISGAGVSLPQGLELGRRYQIRTAVDTTDISDKDNQDGTINRTYKVRQTGDIEILDEGKNIIKAEGKKKVSQSIRASMWYYWNETGPGIPFDDYYEKYGKLMARYIPEIMQFLQNKQ